MMRRRHPLLLFLPLLLLPLLCLAALLWGSVDIPVAEAWSALWTDDGSTAAYIVRHLRLPQMASAVAAGAAMGVAGLVMQTVFDNPLADPSLLGINAGAAVGAAVAMLLPGAALPFLGTATGGYVATMLCAAIGAVMVTALLLLLSAILTDAFRLLIAGVMLSYICGAAVSVMGFFASAEGLQGYMLWGMGDLTGITAERLPAFLTPVAIPLPLPFARANALNALRSRARYAANLGVSIRRERTLLLLLSALLCAAVTALCGPIGFIGLTAPHITRFVHGTHSHFALLPLTALWGACLLLAATLPGHLLDGRTLPPGIVTPLVGVPVVMVLLLSQRQRMQ